MKNRKIFALLIIMGLIITACVKDEVFQGPPVISNVVLAPQSPIENQAVQVSAKVTDLNGVQDVTLFYETAMKAFSEVTMTATGNIYTAQIPGQASGATVSYYIMAKNKLGLITYFPDAAPTSTAVFTVGAPLIVINEVYSRGVPEVDPDWIEIYNDSDAEVNIGGYTVYDNGGQSGAKPKLAIPEGTIIPAKGFFVVVVDIGGENGFGLSSGGEEIWFENANGNLVDNVIFPAMEITQSYGRNPDGSTTWELLNVVTRGEPNSTAAPQAIVKINELYSKGTTENPDWIEIYNTSDFEANIGGFKLYDSDGQLGTKPKKEIPAGTVIPAKSWLVIVVDDAEASGFGLSSTGEEVWFENATGMIIDNVTFPALEVGQSYGRYPDGDANMQVLYVITGGAANDNTTPPPSGIAVINEINSRGTTESPDWVEFFNPSANDLDIGGYKIYDLGGFEGTKPKKEVPAGTILAPGAWYVIVVDDDDPNGSGFGLSSGGEKIWFENVEGVVLDSIEFPAIEEGQSYGRYPDGAAIWQTLLIPTPGAANDNSTPPPTITVVINELFSRGIAEDPDWVEIYNGSNSEIDLSGYKIYDNGGFAGTKPKKEFPAGTMIPANGFFVIVVDDDNPDGSGFGLSSGGEEIWFEAPDGTIINNFLFPEMVEVTYSYGRQPDGTDNFFTFTEVTKGSSNNNATILP